MNDEITFFNRGNIKVTELYVSNQGNKMFINQMGAIQTGTNSKKRMSGKTGCLMFLALPLLGLFLKLSTLSPAALFTILIVFMIVYVSLIMKNTHEEHEFWMKILYSTGSKTGFYFTSDKSSDISDIQYALDKAKRHNMARDC